MLTATVVAGAMIARQIAGKAARDAFVLSRFGELKRKYGQVDDER